VGNDSIITTKLKGNVTIYLGDTQKTLSNVLYVSGLAKNLLAVSGLTAIGL